MPLISETSRERIEKYITGIVKNNKSKLYAIYANPEHVHILISRSPDLSDSELLSNIAKSSNQFRNENKLVIGNLAWQDTASAFSVSKEDVDRVCAYILNQKEHHKKLSFAEECDIFIKHYQETLKK